ncbi:MAG: type II secretion system protein, partial [Ketobacter sp.]
MKRTSNLRIGVKTKTLTANLKGANNNQGFTLIEMVVVIALISILAAVALPRMLDTYDNAHQAAVFGAGGA